MVNILWLKSRASKGLPKATRQAASRHILRRIHCHRKSRHLSINSGVALLRMLQVFQNENAATFTEDQAGSLPVEGPVGPQGIGGVFREQAGSPVHQERVRNDRGLKSAGKSNAAMAATDGMGRQPHALQA